MVYTRRCTCYNGIRDRIMVFIFNGEMKQWTVDYQCEKKKKLVALFVPEVTDFFRN